MNVVIVEDEVLVLRRLQRMTAEVLGSEAEYIETAKNLQEAISKTKNLSNAVVLLDLNLSGKDGFDLIRRAVVEPFQTIIVSANVDRAIEAFELGVVDFVPKPFTKERLRQAFSRIKETNTGNSEPMLAVANAGVTELISISSIVAIHGDGDYSRIETTGDKNFLSNKTLTTLQDLLPEHFIRVHRSHIINLRYAKRIIQANNSKAIQLTDKISVPIGRSYFERISREFIN